jgi:hypothetical protein
MTIMNLDSSTDRDHAIRNGGKIIGVYPDGWLVQVHAKKIGDVTYELADGSIVRRYRHPVR